MAVVGIAAPAPIAQQRFSTRTDVARFEVTVEGNDSPITGLTIADFEVVDSGSAVNGASVLEFSDSPFDMMLVLQPLASHSGDQIKLFEQTLRALLTSIRTSDRLGVILASKGPVRPRPLSAGTMSFDNAAFTGTLEVVLLDSLGASLREFDDAERRSIVLVLSDGMDRLSALTAEMVAAMAARAKPRITFVGASTNLLDRFTIRFVAPPSGGQMKEEITDAKYKNRFPGESLRALAEKTGGQIVDLRDRDPQKAVSQLVARMRSGYLLTFPASQSKGWHPVTVKVKKRGADVTTRAGYFVD